ncbi:MAG: WS/DGAT/MGAT family O-acyltransferase [Actinomycetota bacterium]
MQRLEGLDASFVYLDTPTTPMQVGMTCVFDPATVPGGYSFGKVRRLVEDRLDLVPPFRRRLVGVPGNLHRPVWIEDSEFDLDQHLHRRSLPAPAGPRELEDFTAEVISHPLDRSRPPWEMHIVEGLADGMVAAVTKMHHAAIDGVSGAELTANLLDIGPEPAPVEPPVRPWQPEPAPSPLALVGDAVRELLRQPVVAASTLARAVGAVARLRSHNRRPDTTPPPGPFSAPRTCLNAPVTGRRHVAFAHVSLDDVRQIKDLAGTTVNDVVLAVCAGALRRHLEDHGGYPDRSLVAAVPVSVRTGDHEGAMGNRLSAMLVDLATTVDDPAARLGAIAEGARAAKEQDRLLGPETLSELAGLTPAPLLAAMGALEARFGVTGRMPPVCNLIVSNFPGPPTHLYCAGARMVAAYPMGPVGLGTGLNITVQSYLDTLWFGIVACPDAVPDSERLPGCLVDALGDLTKATAKQEWRQTHPAAL